MTSLFLCMQDAWGSYNYFLKNIYVPQYLTAISLWVLVVLFVRKHKYWYFTDTFLVFHCLL